MNWEQNERDSRVDTLLKNFVQLTTAVQTCIQIKLQVPTLILIYASLDIMGYLNMPADKLSNTADDFCKWADRYFLPNLKDKSCRSIDLYSARCGLLHTMSYESNLTRKEKAKHIMYAWGNADPNVLKRLITKMKRVDIVLHVEDMNSALVAGLQAFLKDIYEDKARVALILRRASKMFTNIKMPK